MEHSGKIMGKTVKPKLFIVAFSLFWLAVMTLDSINLPIFKDEEAFLLNVKFFAQYRTLVPYYAQYPTLYSYLIAPPIYLVFAVFYLIKGLPLDGLKDTAFLRFVFYENLLLWVRVSRLVTMIFSIGTIILTLKRAVAKYTLPVFLVTASMLVLNPFGIYLDLSRFGLPDIPMAFLVTAAMILCFSCIEKKDLKYLWWASFISGLAISTKFNAVFMIFALSAVPLLMERRGWPLVGCYLKIFLLVIIGFLAGSPAFLLSLGTYVKGFSEEAEILFRTGHLGAHGPNWIWVMDFLWSRNAFLAVVMILSIGYSAFKRSKNDILFLSLLVPSFLILGGIQKKSIWYFVFLYPLAALYMGRFVGDVLEKARNRYVRITVICLVFAFIFAMPGWGLYQRLSKSVLPDNRVISQSWICKSIPAGATIAVDWGYVPELRDSKDIEDRINKDRGSAFIKVMEEHYREEPLYDLTQLRDTHYETDDLLKTYAEYVITTSYNYERFFPSKKMYIPKQQDVSHEEFKRKRDFYSALFDGNTPYRLLKVFSSGSGAEIRIYKREP